MIQIICELLLKVIHLNVQWLEFPVRMLTTIPPLWLVHLKEKKKKKKKECLADLLEVPSNVLSI